LQEKKTIFAKKFRVVQRSAQRVDLEKINAEKCA